MNKKVSTLLTVGLMLGGSLLSSSAFAQTGKLIGEAATAESFKSGETYFLYTGNTVLGMSDLNAEGVTAILAHQGTDTKESGKGLSDKFEEADNYMWTVTLEAREGSDSQLHWYYTFTNKATGKQLLYNANGDAFVTDYSNLVEADLKRNNFSLYNYGKYSDNSPLYTGDLNNSVNMNATAQTANIVTEAQVNTGVGRQNISFYTVNTTDVDDSDLNALYNKKGFSFDLDSVVNNSKKDIENIFNQRLVALDVTSTVKAENAQTDANNWGFPVGTYFVKADSKPAVDYDKLTTNDERYEFLKACTFIAVSPTNSVEKTGASRGEGKGFLLEEVKGEDLYKYFGSDKETVSSKTQIPVQNACFEVTYKGSEKYPYSINVKELRVQADNKKDDHKTFEDASISVYEHDDKYYLSTTGSTDNSFKFAFGDAGIVKGIDLLETSGAAVYNIKFVNGANDKTQLNKYLTVGIGNEGVNTWDFVAKGEALAKDVLATPAYQFVITNVEGNNVTFTNRESGTSFTTQLYDEGNGKYSLAIADDSKDNDYVVANILKSTYGVELVKDNSDVVDFDFNDAEIELTKSEVDPFAGFWNVADGTIVTMGFSRDVNNTSNILYAYGADKDNNSGDELFNTTEGAYLTSESYDAAQWKLNKVNNGVIEIKRDYVYNNNGKVAVEPYGDIVKVQKYKLEYVKDAEEQGVFLTYAGSNNNPALKASASTSEYNEYVIRANADGSVEIMTENSVDVDETKKDGGMQAGTTGLGVETDNNKKYVYKELSSYEVVEDAATVKTYLLTNAPVKSWEEAGHVTIQSEVGNYLSMNDAREAIMVDNEGSAYYLYKTDDSEITPSFYITKGMGSENGERLFLFNAVDSLGYQMQGDFDPKYQWSEGMNKLIFKTGILNETADTLALTVKGEVSKLVAEKSNNAQNVWGGLNRFKWQIIETEDGDGYYYIRQKNNDVTEGRYLGSISEKVTWTEKKTAIKFRVAETEAPTSNEGVSATEVKVVANNGSVVVKNAAGKNVVVSTILGQVVANEVLTSDNATINVPAGIVVVAVEGESFKVNVK